MYGAMGDDSKSPEMQALQELHELLRRTEIQKQTGEDMEEIENCDEHAEEHNEMDELERESGQTLGENEVMEGEEEEPGEGMPGEMAPKPKMVHISELAMSKEPMSEEDKQDILSKPLEMLKKAGRPRRV